MKNTLALVGLAVVLGLGIGYFRGWYSIQPETAPNGHRSFDVDINTERIRDDLKKGRQSVSGILHPDQAPTRQDTASTPAVQVTPKGGVDLKPGGALPPLSIGIKN